MSAPSRRTSEASSLAAALATALSLSLALVPIRAAADPSPSPSPSDGSCTKSCHQDLATRSDAKHANVSCVACHPNATGDSHPDALAELPLEQMCSTAGCHPDTAKLVKAGPHKDSTCEVCHGFVHDEFKRFDPGACKGCHGDQVKAVAASAHTKDVACSDCHGATHTARKTSADPLAPMSRVMQLDTCGECHTSASVKSFRGSVHGRGLIRSGLVVAPTCSSCHGAHDIAKHDAPDSRVSGQRIGETCGTCHALINTAFRESVHFEAAEKGQEAPTCATCHSGHGVADPAAGQNRTAMLDSCAECHASEHHSYKDSFHGKATQLGLSVAATCSDCHAPHRILAKTNPASPVSPENVEETCRRCHAGATASFARFEPHLDPTTPEDNRPLYYVWLFMSTLLVSVLLAFAVHTLLWFQRAAVAVARGELKPASHEGTVWVRRFKPIHRWIHLTVIVTFLTLAATGLPLKFSYLEQARLLSGFFGGLAGSRLLHRVAGALTFAYAFVYLGYLIREVVIRKRRELLWGWQSMIPNRKDLSDLVGNLRWFLYLGPRPRFDRWTYWEKFDFFAVFWGIPVIGLSGLALWFAESIARAVPGTVLNLAYLVHSDEALLATGFIFFFHFFHVNLRPESFPMDPVMFLGSMPLERFKEERPAEYERLKASGELERRLVPPPREQSRTLAYLFGFFAMGTGLLLGGLLLVAGLSAVFK